MSDAPKLTMQEQEELATKVVHLVTFVGLLKDSEVETLKQMAKNLREQNSTLQAVSGTLVDMDEANHKVSRQQAMIKRINALIAIHESNIDMQDADEEFESSKDQREVVARMFGL